jgi:hypothetical protein
MMEKLAQPGEGGGVHHTYPLSLYLPLLAKLWCIPQLRGQSHLPLFLLYPYMYSVQRTLFERNEEKKILPNTHPEHNIKDSKKLLVFQNSIGNLKPAAILIQCPNL